MGHSPMYSFVKWSFPSLVGTTLLVVDYTPILVTTVTAVQAIILGLLAYKQKKSDTKTVQTEHSVDLVDQRLIELELGVAQLIAQIRSLNVEPVWLPERHHGHPKDD